MVGVLAVERRVSMAVHTEGQLAEKHLTGKLQLDRKLIVRAFAACREGERSIDRILPSECWRELRAYYDSNKMASLRAVVGELSARIGDDYSPGSIAFQELCRELPFVSVATLQGFVQRWIIPRKRTFVF